jgi:hypothetical protein
MMAVCTTYALLIPEDVLTRFPVLTGFTSFMENLFPAIGSFAKFSPIPEVVRLYYSTMWVAFPAILVWFMKTVQLQERDVPAYPHRAKALLALLVFCGATALLFYLMALHVPKSFSLNQLDTGGRANALILGLTHNWTSIGIMSALIFCALCIFVSFTKAALIYLIKGNKNV